MGITLRLLPQVETPTVYYKTLITWFFKIDKWSICILDNAGTKFSFKSFMCDICRVGEVQYHNTEIHLQNTLQSQQQHVLFFNQSAWIWQWDEFVFQSLKQSFCYRILKGAERKSSQILHPFQSYPNVTLQAMIK